MSMTGDSLNTLQIVMNYEEIENRLQIIGKEIDSNNSMFSALLRFLGKKGVISREEVLLDAIFCPDNEEISDEEEVKQSCLTE